MKGRPRTHIWIQFLFCTWWKKSLHNSSLEITPWPLCCQAEFEGILCPYDPATVSNSVNREWFQAREYEHIHKVAQRFSHSPGMKTGTESLMLWGIAVTTNLAFHKGGGKSIICTYIEAGTEAAHPGTDSKGWGEWVEVTAASDLVWPGRGLLC